MKIHYTAPVWHGGFHKFFGNALHSLGHEIVFFNEAGGRVQQFARRALTRIPKFQYRGADMVRERIAREWLRSVRDAKPNLIIIQSAPNILPWAIEKAKRLAPVFYWVDSPPAGSQAGDMIAGLRVADKLFTIDRTWMTILFDPHEFEFLPLAADPETFKPLPAEREKHGVVFVGSMPPQSGDGCLRASIASAVAEAHPITVFGSGADYWARYFPNLESHVASTSALPDTELNKLYNRACIVLNIHSTWHQSSVSGRTYEIGLSGAFQLVDHRSDLTELFPGDLLPTFRSAAEVPGLVGEWLGRSPEERKDRAARVREYVLAHHTWKHRAEALLQHFT